MKGDNILQYLSIIRKCLLFSGISDENISAFLKNANAKIKRFEKNQTIRPAEEQVTEIGIVLEGLAYMSTLNAEGKRVILTQLTVGTTFGEALVITQDIGCPITITAAKNSAVLVIPAVDLVHSKNTPLGNCDNIRFNLLRLLAHKSMILQIKTDILSQKNTREKLMLYFEYESKFANSNTFKINYSREELADFLGLNSSALSRELGKMRDDGLLSFMKNKFTLKKS